MNLIKTMQVIDSGALEGLIRQEYGKYYSVAAALEASNDTLHYQEVPEYVDDDGRNYAISSHGFCTMEYWLTAEPDQYGYGPQPILGDIINDLHAKGHIPEGDYRLYVSW